MTLETPAEPRKLDYLSEADFTPKFRAVRTGDHRRGIRLEQIFWTALARLAKEEGTTVAQVVEAAETSFPQSGNITSVLRVVAIGWMQRQLAHNRPGKEEDIVSNLVRASPVPAIALAADRKLISYNAPFLTYVQSQLGLSPSSALPRNLRLILDVQFGDLIRTLETNGNRAIRTGILLGAEEKRVRGTLNVVLAPVQKEPILIGYLSG
ncbi:MAG TPA: ribbon-helix-helix domain-containing protein [Sphingomicrobium sp.]|jgi:predicted DNA-binding ribbon-helix-helix protein|nr:ribbon-helix-helix domain-containing protein [Sphingomicrobium sp.]